MPLYFAYGSNMSAENFSGRCPDAELVCGAELVGYRLAFNLISTRWGGRAVSVEPSDGDSVFGILWQVSEADLAALDLIEGKYERIEVKVRRLSDESAATAFTYQVRDEHRELDEGPPIDEYRNLMLTGATEAGLPDPYIEVLRSAG